MVVTNVVVAVIDVDVITGSVVVVDVIDDDAVVGITDEVDASFDASFEAMDNLQGERPDWNC